MARRLKAIPMEVSWAREKMDRAWEAIENGEWASAAAALDIARLHLECAALSNMQILHPRTEASQRLEEKHVKIRKIL